MRRGKEELPRYMSEKERKWIEKINQEHEWRARACMTRTTTCTLQGWREMRQKTGCERKMVNGANENIMIRRIRRKEARKSEIGPSPLCDQREIHEARRKC